MAQQMPTLYVTSMEVNNLAPDFIYAPSSSGPGFRVVGGVRGYGSVELTMSMDYTPGASLILDAIRDNGWRLPFGIERREYRCIYCGVANPIAERWCSQCAAPRGWIL